MEDFDVTELEESKRDKVLTEGRKVLESEYMDPQAPSAEDAKKSEGAAADDANLASEHAAKAKAKYQDRQNREREERIRQRDAQKKGGRDSKGATGANRQKRARDDDQQEEEPDSKRQRDEEGAKEPETEGSSKSAEQTEEKDTATTAAAGAQIEQSDEKPAEKPDAAT
jgi:hypothetical protein